MLAKVHSKVCFFFPIQWSDTEIRTDSKKMQRTPSKSEPPEVAPPTPSQPVTATPDYAAGLGAEYVPGPPLQTGVYPDRSEGLGEVGGVAVPRAKSVEERAAVRHIAVVKMIQNMYENLLSCHLGSISLCWSTIHSSCHSTVFPSSIDSPYSCYPPPSSHHSWW